MSTPNLTYLNLAEPIRRMAKMAAALNATSLSEYIARVIEADCRRSGIAGLVGDDDREASDER